MYFDFGFCPDYELPIFIIISLKQKLLSIRDSNDSNDSNDPYSTVNFIIFKHIKITVNHLIPTIHILSMVAVPQFTILFGLLPKEEEDLLEEVAFSFCSQGK